MRLRINEKVSGITLVILGLGGLIIASFNSFPLKQNLSAPNVYRTHEAPQSATTSNPLSQPSTSTASKSASSLGHLSPDVTSIQQDLETPSPIPGDEGTVRQSCKVIRVYDGDTLGCDLNANGRIENPEELVRLLGIDSPEMHYSRKNPTYGTSNPKDSPFAKEASLWLTQQAEGKTVYLEFDRKRWDRYQRNLAYVYADPQKAISLNEQALAGGYARTLFIGQNRRYQGRFEEAQLSAQRAKKGMWAYHSQAAGVVIVSTKGLSME